MVYREGRGSGSFLSPWEERKLGACLTTSSAASVSWSPFNVEQDGESSQSLQGCDRRAVDADVKDGKTIENDAHDSGLPSMTRPSSSSIESLHSQGGRGRQRDNHAKHCGMIRHLVLPSDTLTGLCLAYKVSKQVLQRANPGCCISGDGLRLAARPGDRLNIPIATNSTYDVCAGQQDQSTAEFKIALVLEECRHLNVIQAESILMTQNWNVKNTVEQSRNDLVRKAEAEEEERQKERQRKRDALEIQRILTKQKADLDRQKEKLYSDNFGSRDTELTRLTCGHGDSALYTDQPKDNETVDKDNVMSCLQGCCSFTCLVVFEAIRLASIFQFF